MVNQIAKQRFTLSFLVFVSFFYFFLSVLLFYSAVKDRNSYFNFPSLFLTDRNHLTSCIILFAFLAVTADCSYSDFIANLCCSTALTL